jgi:hypothetical protein
MAGRAACATKDATRPTGGFAFTTTAPFGCLWLDTALTVRYLRAIVPGSGVPG